MQALGGPGKFRPPASTSHSPPASGRQHVPFLQAFLPQAIRQMPPSGGEHAGRADSHASSAHTIDAFVDAPQLSGDAFLHEPGAEHAILHVVAASV